MAESWAGRPVTRARAAIRARGQYLPCWRCGRVMDLDAERWQVGHIIDRRLGGPAHDPANQEPECQPCNSSAGGKLGAAIRRQGRRVSVDREQRTRRW